MPNDVNNENAQQQTGGDLGAGQSQAVKTKRDIALEKLKARHPDTDYVDDEAIYGAINDDYDADQKALTGYRDNEKKMSEMMSKDPRNAAFLKAMMGGKDPVLSLVEEFGDDFLDYLSDPDNRDALNEARKKHLEKLTKSKELDEQADKNLEKSLDVMDAYDEKYGEDVTNAALEQYAKDVNDYLLNNIKESTLDTYRLASSHDEDVENAAHVAEVKGRNANITKHVRLKKAGDGTKDLEGGSSARDERKELLKPDYGALEEASSRPNIYEAGGFKRIRRS